MCTRTHAVSRYVICVCAGAAGRLSENNSWYVTQAVSSHSYDSAHAPGLQRAKESNSGGCQLKMTDERRVAESRQPTTENSLIAVRCL